MKRYRHVFLKSNGEELTVDASGNRPCDARDQARNNLAVLVNDPGAWKLISQTVLETT